MSQFDDDDVSSDLGGTYLRQSDFSNGIGQCFRISRVEKINFEARNGRPEYDKWVTFFSDGRQFSLNKTNLALIVKWFGKHYRAWIGQVIAVYCDESVSFAGRLTGGLRVRKPLPQDLPVVDREETVAEVLPL